MGPNFSGHGTCAHFWLRSKIIKKKGEEEEEGERERERGRLIYFRLDVSCIYLYYVIPLNSRKNYLLIHTHSYILKEKSKGGRIKSPCFLVHYWEF